MNVASTKGRSLRGARILVVGASGGIGRPLAAGLAERGSRLAVAGRDGTRPDGLDVGETATFRYASSRASTRSVRFARSWSGPRAVSRRTSTTSRQQHSASNMHSSRRAPSSPTTPSRSDGRSPRRLPLPERRVRRARSRHRRDRAAPSLRDPRSGTRTLACPPVPGWSAVPGSAPDTGGRTTGHWRRRWRRRRGRLTSQARIEASRSSHR